MKIKYIVSDKELDILDSYFTYGHDDPCVRCPPRSKMECCGCKTADTILKPLEIVERRLTPDIFKCEPVMNYALGAAALENLNSKMLALEVQCNKVQKEISDLRQAFTVDYEGEE